MARALFAVFLCLCVACCLGGCKYSDVLTEHIEDPEIGVLDENAEPEYKEVPGAPYDPTRSSVIEPDTDRIDEQEEETPEFDEETPDERTTDARQQTPDSADTSAATRGLLAALRAGQNLDAGDAEKQTETQAGAGQGAGDGTTNESREQTGEGFDDGPASGGIGGTGTVYDATGTNMQLPSGVNKVAAAGQYATIVQMLAGKGALVAADGEWKSKVAAQGLFPGEGCDEVASVWSGSAAEGFALDIDALIAAAPDAVLADGYNVALSADDQARLQQAKIDVITVPTLDTPDTPDANITSGVRVVGQLLANAATTYDASRMATMYVQQHDDALNNCVRANGGYSFKMVMGSVYAGIYQGTGMTGEETTNLSSVRYTTAFFDGWTYSVTPFSVAIRAYGDYTMYLDGMQMDASEGAGTSAAGISQNFQLIDYYLQTSGVVNNAYEGAKPSLSGAAVALPSLIAPGDTSQLVAGVVFSPRTAPSALWYSPGSVTTANVAWLTAGDPTFPAVLVRNSDIASRVCASAAKTNGLYNVGQSYSVRVVPQGLAGSWADGTVESFLLAPWAYCVFQQGADLSVASGYVADFYSTFYRSDAGVGAVQNYDAAYTATCPRS